jgi:predicted nucleic acid-binding protein
VLDTQAVLDWLYFGDPATLHWETWRQAGHWHWVVGAAMRDELAHVLGRGSLPAGQGLAGPALLEVFDARARVLPAPVPTLANPLRCSDPDDQKFIDFALAHRVAWLVSRDRAVLKLKRRAQAVHAVNILTPRDWAPLAVPV